MGFSYPLPVTVIAEMMGIRLRTNAKIQDMVQGNSRVYGDAKATPEILFKSQDALLAMQQYFRDIYAKRRQGPEDDLITALVQAELEGDKLTEEEMVSSCVTILIGGHETTTYLIANGVYALLQHPEQLSLLKGNPELADSATEEFLRYEGPFQRNRGIAPETRDRDMLIKKGQLACNFWARQPRSSPVPQS